jgi:hypothetical protein
MGIRRHAKDVTAISMSILTDRELEFLATLRSGWRRFYWNELVCLVKEDTAFDTRHETHLNAPQSRRPNGFIPS